MSRIRSSSSHTHTIYGTKQEIEFIDGRPFQPENEQSPPDYLDGNIRMRKPTVREELAFLENYRKTYDGREHWGKIDKETVIAALDAKIAALRKILDSHQIRAEAVASSQFD